MYFALSVLQSPVGAAGLYIPVVVTSVAEPVLFFYWLRLRASEIPPLWAFEFPFGSELVIIEIAQAPTMVLAQNIFSFCLQIFIAGYKMSKLGRFGSGLVKKFPAPGSATLLVSCNQLLRLTCITSLNLAQFVRIC